ncbi:MAG: hypothetical protein U0R52_09380 [Solirubrobacterales bacterium]
MDPSGPAGSAQEAEALLPAGALEHLWRPESLERLARAYWAYLERISLGAVRVVYEPEARLVTLLNRRLVLLRFQAPRYETGPGFGQVTWPIERGLLVSAPGRGFLRINVRRVDGAEVAAGARRVIVRTEVQNYYPLLRGRGRFARIGARLYSATQLRGHRLITRGFLRSLAAFDLPPSPIGSAAVGEGDAAPHTPARGDGA